MLWIDKAITLSMLKVLLIFLLFHGSFMCCTCMWLAWVYDYHWRKKPRCIVYFICLIQQDYEDALIEVQNQIAKGISLNELHSSFSTSSTKRVVDNREQLKSGMTYSYKWKHNVDQWLQNHTTGPAKTTMTNSALMDLVDKSMGGDDVVSRRSYHVGNYEVVVSFFYLKSLLMSRRINATKDP